MSEARMSRVQLVILAVLVPAVLVGAYVIGARSGGDTSPPAIDITRADDADEFDHDFLIPAGTADRMESGESIEIVPAELVVGVGDTLRIVNEDTADHVVGVLFVAAGETLTQRFNSPAVLEGECSVHPSGAFTLRVVDDPDGA
ncbi:MAG: cupredoxin domain-containing protein [Ilumatobacteraceae bacterium]